MADLGWSDCGRKTASQNFYPRKGRIGKKMVGGCGNFEAKGALYAARLSKRWAALFLLKNGREPSDGETFFAFRTGQAARDVKSWEKMPLATFVEDKKPGKINISHNGESYANILQKWLDDRRAKEDAEKQRLIQKNESLEEKDAPKSCAIARFRALSSSESPTMSPTFVMRLSCSMMSPRLV